jgi:histone H3/H4
VVCYVALVLRDDPEMRTIIFLTGNTLSMADLIVKSGVKDALAENNVSADFYDALNQEVAGLLEEAADRAEANGRKTVQPSDL